MSRKTALGLWIFLLLVATGWSTPLANSELPGNYRPNVPNNSEAFGKRQVVGSTEQIDANNMDTPKNDSELTLENINGTMAASSAESESGEHGNASRSSSEEEQNGTTAATVADTGNDNDNDSTLMPELMEQTTLLPSAAVAGSKKTNDTADQLKLVAKELKDKLAEIEADPIILSTRV